MKHWKTTLLQGQLGLWQMYWFDSLHELQECKMWLNLNPLTALTAIIHPPLRSEFSGEFVKILPRPVETRIKTIK